MTDGLDSEFIEPERSRQHIDITLRHGAFENDVTVIEIQTVPLQSDCEQTNNCMTLDSYGRYFSNLSKDTQWTHYPYSMFDEHWIVCFAYQWDIDLNTRKMVCEAETVIGQK